MLEWVEWIGSNYNLTCIWLYRMKTELFSLININIICFVCWFLFYRNSVIKNSVFSSSLPIEPFLNIQNLGYRELKILVSMISCNKYYLFGICLIIFKLELKMTVPSSCKRLRTLYLTFFAFHLLCHDDRINIWPHNSKELIATALHLQMFLFLVSRCIKRSYEIPPFCDTLFFPLNNILFTNCTIGLRVSFWFIFMI